MKGIKLHQIILSNQKLQSLIKKNNLEVCNIYKLLKIHHENKLQKKEKKRQQNLKDKTIIILYSLSILGSVK